MNPDCFSGGEKMLYIGTIGEGLFRSEDAGETFKRDSEGIFIEADVRSIVVSPSDPRRIYVGTNMGLYRSADGGSNFERLPGPFDPGEGWMGGVAIWSLLILPDEGETLIVGTCPSGIYRSTDGGKTWETAKTELSPECVAIRYPRVTCLLADPEDSSRLWAGVEIDGVHTSEDAGKTWKRIGEGLSSTDIHSLVALPRKSASGERVLLAATNNDQNISEDAGRTWTPQHVKSRFQWGYCRGLWQSPNDPRLIFQGNGNGPPGSEGAIQISRDEGATWTQAELPSTPNSTIWDFSSSALAPDCVYAYSVSGQVFATQDSGRTWRKIRREFGEIRAILTLP